LKASDNKFPGIILNEAADDGSDFSNPDADYRRLFLGEDGALHLKDSAGAVTDVDVGIPETLIAAKGDLIVGTANDTAGILTVGTNDYVLTADSGEATGLKWAAAAAGGAVATDAIWDAAGDLAVGSADNTAARLAVGTDDYVLTADAAATNGVKWAAVPTGTPTFVGARAKRSTGTSIDNATWTPLTLDGEDFDSGSLHDNSTNPSRITVPTTGYYLVTGMAKFATADNDGCRYISFAVDGSRTTNIQFPPHATQVGIAIGSDIVSLTSGQYVEMHIYQDSGAAMNVSGYLAVALIGV